MPDLTELADRWQADLAAWAIPEHITASVSESPWVLPRQVFARRADRLAGEPSGPSYEREWAALDPPGSVLDVGAGAGAACLPLLRRATAVTAVDTDPGMLELLSRRATAMGIAASQVLGRWPEVAAATQPADVVTCHHVLYNAPEPVPFVAELTSHARRRVVVETTAQHPLTTLNPFWLKFHGLGGRPPLPQRISWKSSPPWACGREPRRGPGRAGPTTPASTSSSTSPDGGSACRRSAPPTSLVRWRIPVSTPGTRLTWAHPAVKWSRSGGRATLQKSDNAQDGRMRVFGCSED